LVLPIYNEEEAIPELHRRLQILLAKLGMKAEVVFVDDGSLDGSLSALRRLSASEPRYGILSLARNFGHQAAITAGIDHARGDAVVVMDADLQDPPEVILEMVVKWREGYDVVYGARRRREKETWFKKATAHCFYRLFASLIPIEVPVDAGDFRLVSRRVVRALRELRESHRFVRGLISWVGFKQTRVLYDRPGRFAGKTKYPLRKMLHLALDGITSFSVVPLRFSTYLGSFMSLASLGVVAWALVAKYVFQRTVTGWTAIMVVVALFAGVQFLMIGILGEYIGRIFEEVKQRPLYVLRDAVNVPHARGAARARRQFGAVTSTRSSLRPMNR